MERDIRLMNQNLLNSHINKKRLKISLSPFSRLEAGENSKQHASALIKNMFILKIASYLLSAKRKVLYTALCVI